MEKNIELKKEFQCTFMMLQRYFLQRRGELKSSNTFRGQGRVLAILKMKPEITQKELCFILGVRNQSLSEILTKLEKAGFITRTPSEEDKRIMNIKITDEGCKEADKIKESEQMTSTIFDCLTQEEQDNLKEYLSKINAEVKSRIGDENLHDHKDMHRMMHHMRHHHRHD